MTWTESGERERDRGMVILDGDEEGARCELMMLVMSRMGMRVAVLKFMGMMVMKNGREGVSMVEML